ncbi:LysE family translocator [Leucobacter sp. W1478]|uniref:LysE family translocator n=1 Tax=Leucobacter sp. W1478 TaxID=3439065 RepID=UPI003F2DDD1B
MPTMQAVLAFALASLILVVIPGPSVLFAVARTLSVGRAGGLITVAGNTFGQFPLIFAVAFGVGAIVAQSVALFTAIKLAGAAYLIYLGVQAIRHRQGGAEATRGEVRSAAPKRTLFWQGFVVGVSNPKSIVFFIAALPQFVDFHAGSVPLQMLVLGCVFVVIALASDGVWVLIAGTARDWFADSPKRLSTMRGIGGGMLIGLGGVLALSGSKA